MGQGRHLGQRWGLSSSTSVEAGLRLGDWAARGSLRAGWGVPPESREPRKARGWDQACGHIDHGVGGR